MDIKLNALILNSLIKCLILSLFYSYVIEQSILYAFIFSGLLFRPGVWSFQHQMFFWQTYSKKNVTSCSMRPLKAVIMFLRVWLAERRRQGVLLLLFMSFWEQVGVLPCPKIPAPLWFVFHLSKVTRPTHFWRQLSIEVNSWKPQFTAVYVRGWLWNTV